MEELYVRWLDGLERGLNVLTSSMLRCGFDIEVVARVANFV